LNGRLFQQCGKNDYEARVLEGGCYVIVVVGVSETQSSREKCLSDLLAEGQLHGVFVVIGNNASGPT
jgi:hypothetical protein